MLKATHFQIIPSVYHKKDPETALLRSKNILCDISFCLFIVGVTMHWRILIFGALLNSTQATIELFRDYLLMYIDI